MHYTGVYVSFFPLLDQAVKLPYTLLIYGSIILQLRVSGIPSALRYTAELFYLPLAMFSIACEYDEFW